jgi:hypothetical protein
LRCIKQLNRKLIETSDRDRKEKVWLPEDGADVVGLAEVELIVTVLLLDGAIVTEVFVGVAVGVVLIVVVGRIIKGVVLKSDPGVTICWTHAE